MFVDTTVLVEILRRSRKDPVSARLRETLGDEPLFCSSIQLGELADHHRRVGAPLGPSLDLIRRLLEIVPVDAETALLASELKAEARRHRMARNFSLIDGVILASARRRGQRLLTLAREFSVFPETVLFPAGHS